MTKAPNIPKGKPTIDKMCDCPLHTLRPQRIADLIEPERIDLQAACDLIGTDSYGNPHWTVATIHPHNSVVQAFARHRVRARAAIAAMRPTKQETRND